MITSADFQRQILAVPGDVSCWLLWADWLEEHGSAGVAEVLRLRSELTQQVNVTQRAAKEARLQALLYQEQLQPPALTITNSVGMELQLLPPGQFLMGSPIGEPGRDRDEGPVLVTLQRPFWLGPFLVTQGQFQRVMGFNPSWFSSNRASQKELGDFDTSDCPVENVDWFAARNFCQKLTVLEKQAGILGHNWQYTLPTEAQWEYACRAGTSTPFYFGSEAHLLPKFAWFGHEWSHPQPVGGKPANPFGLYDMIGNVWEWCQDSFEEHLLGGIEPVCLSRSRRKCCRGGSWDYLHKAPRSAYRFFNQNQFVSDDLGFRVALICNADWEQPTTLRAC